MGEREDGVYLILTRTRTFFIFFLLLIKNVLLFPLLVILRHYLFLINFYVLSSLVYVSKIISFYFFPELFHILCEFSGFWVILFFHSPIIVLCPLACFEMAGYDFHVFCRHVFWRAVIAYRDSLLFKFFFFVCVCVQYIFMGFSLYPSAAHFHMK